MISTRVTHQFQTQQRQWLSDRLAAEQRVRESHVKLDVLRSLLNPRVLALASLRERLTAAGFRGQLLTVSSLGSVVDTASASEPQAAVAPDARCTSGMDPKPMQKVDRRLASRRFLYCAESVDTVYEFTF